MWPNWDSATYRSPISTLPVFDAATLEQLINDYITGHGLKFKQVGPPVRVALMGFLGGPHLHEIMAVLGREETLARLHRAAALQENTAS